MAHEREVGRLDRRDEQRVVGGPRAVGRVLEEARVQPVEDQDERRRFRHQLLRPGVPLARAAGTTMSTNIRATKKSHRRRKRPHHLRHRDAAGRRVGRAARRQAATPARTAHTPITTHRLNDVPSSEKELQRDADGGDPREVRDADRPRETARRAPAAEEPQEAPRPRRGTAGCRRASPADVGDHERPTLPRYAGRQAVDRSLQQPASSRSVDRPSAGRPRASRSSPPSAGSVTAFARQEVAERPLPERPLRRPVDRRRRAPGSTCRPSGMRRTALSKISGWTP